MLILNDEPSFVYAQSDNRQSDNSSISRSDTSTSTSMPTISDLFASDSLAWEAFTCGLDRLAIDPPDGLSMESRRVWWTILTEGWRFADQYDAGCIKEDILEN